VRVLGRLLGAAVLAGVGVVVAASGGSPAWASGSVGSCSVDVTGAGYAGTASCTIEGAYPGYAIDSVVTSAYAPGGDVLEVECVGGPSDPGIESFSGVPVDESISGRLSCVVYNFPAADAGSSIPRVGSVGGYSGWSYDSGYYSGADGAVANAGAGGGGPTTTTLPVTSTTASAASAFEAFASTSAGRLVPVVLVLGSALVSLLVVLWGTSRVLQIIRARRSRSGGSGLNRYEKWAEAYESYEGGYDGDGELVVDIADGGPFDDRPF
jgi:hypothetical protein